MPSRGCGGSRSKHPATQSDKRLRLKRLEIDASHINFVAVDLSGGGTKSALVQTGWAPDGRSLMLCEGLAVYLDAGVLETLLKDLRALAGVGTRLAISMSPPVTDPDQPARRRFRAAIEALGEPARNDLTAADAEGMLATARWRLGDVSDRSQRAGLAVFAPV